jgi:HEAT repeat protein
MRRFLPLALLLLPAFLRAADKPVPPELLKGLEDKEPAARIKAIKALGKLGIEAVPALGVLRVEPKQLVAALEPHLKDPLLAVRAGVTSALRKGGSPAVPALRTALADKDTSVRRQAVLSLEVVVARSSDLANEVLPVLVKAIKDDSGQIRVDLARALSRCGSEALTPLLTLADDPDAKVRAYAIIGLVRVKPPAEKVLAILAKKVKEDPESMVRQSALQTLASLGKAAVPAASAALSDKDPSVQKTAVRTLAKIGKDAKAAIPALKETATKAENTDVRSAAVLALGQMGKEGEETLVGLLGRDDSVTRLACLQFLGRLGKAPKSAVPDLIKALSDRDADVRVLSAHILGLMGADAKAALPALEKARKDADERVRMVAEKAIGKIKGP